MHVRRNKKKQKCKGSDATLKRTLCVLCINEQCCTRSDATLRQLNEDSKGSLKIQKKMREMDVDSSLLRTVLSNHHIYVTRIKYKQGTRSQ